MPFIAILVFALIIWWFSTSVIDPTAISTIIGVIMGALLRVGFSIGFQKETGIIS